MPTLRHICGFFAVAIAFSPAFAQPTLDQQSITLSVGAVQKLNLGNIDAGKVTWRSSDPQVARVYGDGLVVGLHPGAAKVSAISRANASATCSVAVSFDEPRLIDPATLEQYDDNRSFTVDGRRCFGSVLNGQRAFDPAERKNTKSNRIINPSPIDADHPLEWTVEDGAEIFDGAGILMGTVAPRLKSGDGKRVPTCKFNFGMSKVIDGKLCIYAFSTPIVPSKEIANLVDPKALEDGAVDTSAWLPVDRVINKDALLSRIGLGKPPLPALPLKDESYRITGGDPKKYVIDFGECAIVKSVKENNAVPSHYLRRPSGTVNLCYSVPGFGLGGQGLDSFLINHGATFRPAKGAREFVQPTYYPMLHPKQGEVSPLTMTFIYGAVEIPGRKQNAYGWIAKDALSTK
jgi:hypothetical protein